MSGGREKSPQDCLCASCDQLTFGEHLALEDTQERLLDAIGGQHGEIVYRPPLGPVGDSDRMASGMAKPDGVEKAIDGLLADF